MRKGFLIAFRLAHKHIIPGELSPLYKSIFIGIHVAICLSTYIAEEFTKVERRIGIEEISQENDSIGCISEIEHIEKETTSEQPLHNNRVKHKSIENTHA